MGVELNERSRSQSAVLLCTHVFFFSLRVLPSPPPFPLIFHSETMPPSKVLCYANAFAPSASKAIVASAHAQFCIVRSEVLCKNDLGRVQRFDRRLGSCHDDITRSRSSTFLLPDVTNSYRC